MWSWLEKIFLGDLTDGWKEKPLLLVPSKAEMKKMTKKEWKLKYKAKMQQKMQDKME